MMIVSYRICDFPRRCHGFEPTSCHLSPIHLSYIAISRPCRSLYRKMQNSDMHTEVVMSQPLVDFTSLKKDLTKLCAKNKE